MPNVGEVLADVEALESEEARRSFFDLHAALWHEATVDELAGRATALLRIDLRKAERLVATALWLAGRIDSKFASAKAHRANANFASVRGAHGEALDECSVARRLFSELGDEVEAAITSSSSLAVLSYMGEQEEAVAQAQFARGVCHLRQHDFSQALDFYERTRAFCQENDLAVLVSELDYNIAYLHYLRGQYTQALELYRESRRQHSELGERHHVDLSALNEAEIYLELNLTQECEDLAREAYRGFESRGSLVDAARAMTSSRYLLRARESHSWRWTSSPAHEKNFRESRTSPSRRSSTTTAHPSSSEQGARTKRRQSRDLPPRRLAARACPPSLPPATSFSRELPSTRGVGRNVKNNAT